MVIFFQCHIREKLFGDKSIINCLYFDVFSLYFRISNYYVLNLAIMARDLNWEKITSLVESASSSTAILNKGKMTIIIIIIIIII